MDLYFLVFLSFYDLSLHSYERTIREDKNRFNKEFFKISEMSLEDYFLCLFSLFFLKIGIKAKCKDELLSCRLKIANLSFLKFFLSLRGKFHHHQKYFTKVHGDFWSSILTKFKISYLYNFSHILSLFEALRKFENFQNPFEQTIHFLAHKSSGTQLALNL